MTIRAVVPQAAPPNDRLAGYAEAARASRPALDELLRRARELGPFPVAWIGTLDGAQELLHARHGIDLERLAPGESFTGLTHGKPAFIDDASRHAWSRHPLVSGAAALRCLAVLPLVCADGFELGSLVVAHPRPRPLRREQRSGLENLAALVLARLEARRDPLPPMVDEAGEALERERAFSRAVIESLGGAFYLVSAEGLIVRWNSLLAAAIGYSDAEIAAMRPADFISPRDRAAVEALVNDVLHRGREAQIEAEVVDRAGNVRPYALTGKPVRLGAATYMIGVARDITARKRAEQQMARAKERLDLALASSSLALWDWDLKQSRVYFNENWSQILGDAPRESTFTSDQVLEQTHADDREVVRAAIGNAVKGVSEEFDCEYRVIHAGGEWIWVHSRGKVTQRDPAGQALRMTGTSTNITKRKRAEERAEYLATRDALTGLPNRVLLHDRLELGVANAARHGTGFAFMFIDLDRFKTINDSLGHHVGDELLKGVAGRLTACVRATDTVARLGGDEFAVILENLRGDDDEGAQSVADKMIAAMASPMIVEGQALNTSCSIGISLYPADGRDSGTLMKNADVAMYFAKEKGRNNYQFFSQNMNARAQERLSVENYLRLALKRHELVMHYQPRMKVATGELVGVEALVRWQHPRRGLLPPAKFIDVAEDSGLIVPIGEWVLQAACAQAAAWQARRPGLRVSVNLSVGQVMDGDRFCRAVEAALREARLDPRLLELELTESHLIQDIEEKAALLNRLGDLGVGIAIDDFGTGYSSLSYLKKLPVDAIKIDGSFVRDIGKDANDEAIIQAILAMAHSLKLSVVAEGVETEAQLEALRALGCDEYQGFLESPGLAAADFHQRYL
jgi:diguanylate cyclase (GGDEF)-like protein/PAS domain S-box-containing protein